jgi:hypothetical protein
VHWTALADLYKPFTSAVAAAKVTVCHSAALRKAEGALHVVVHRRTAAQAHAATIALLSTAVLDNWRINIQGYTAAEMAKAAIVAVEETLQRPIMVVSVHDDTVAHCDAFAVINTAGVVGFAECLTTSVVRACEPGLRMHLCQNVPDDELVRQVQLGTPTFVRFVASHAKLAAEKIAAADSAARTHPAVAALEVVVAGLRTDHRRLELQLREQQGRQEQGGHEQRRREH